jgi:hypothetical protein
MLLIEHFGYIDIVLSTIVVLYCPTSTEIQITNLLVILRGKRLQDFRSEALGDTGQCPNTVRP